MRTKEKSTNIIYLRHGETDYPSNRIYCDDIEDPELNAKGLIQAESTATLFKSLELSAIYSSPAKRTRMTASAVSDICGLSPKMLPEWVERRFGVWEGLYFKEIEDNFPSEYQKWKADMLRYTPDKGETIEDVKNRLDASLNRIISTHSGENVLIVTHVGPIRICVCEAMNIPLENYRQIRIDHASKTQIDYGETKNNLIYTNQYIY